MTSRLTAADLEVHRLLGITRTCLDAFQVHRVDDREARELLAVDGRPGRLNGIMYPYIDPIDGHVGTRRLRRDHCEVEEGKPRNKYIAAYGDHRHLYFPPDVAHVLSDRSVSVIAVEAEKSVQATWCAADRTGRRVLPIGLGGCYGWRGRIGRTEDAHGARVDEVGPLPDLDRVAWQARDLIVAFDSNAASNRHVQRARREFCLTLARRGALVRILQLPEEPGINGPDEYIGRYGDQAFFARVDAATDARTFDVIFRLNLTHAVVREAGKTIVITEENDPVLDRQIHTRSSFADFRNFYLGEQVQVGTDKQAAPVYRPIGHMWLADPDHRRYHGIVMSPAGDVPGYLNLWRGFAIEPKAGDWSRFRQHLYEVICNACDDLFDYVMAWLAFGVQHPDRRAEIALALRGPRGAGKGMFARAYGELFGQHYLQIANTKHLVGHFNAHLQDAVVLFADEAFWAGDKAGESVLKMLITEPVIPIERKGRDVVVAKNLLHIIIGSNHEWIVPAGIDERRFCVLDINPRYQQDHAYFGALMDELDERGGRAAMLYDLLHHNLTGINLRAVPQTEALRQQKVLSLLPNERWLFDKLMAGRWLPEHDGWYGFIAKDALHDDYVKTLQKAGVERRSTETELGMFMARMIPNVTTERRVLDDKRVRGWALPNLQACREAFDQATRSEHPWPED